LPKIRRISAGQAVAAVLLDEGRRVIRSLVDEL
jgi:hypothetical protein